MTSSKVIEESLSIVLEGTREEENVLVVEWNENFEAAIHEKELFLSVNIQARNIEKSPFVVVLNERIEGLNNKTLSLSVIM